MCVRCDGNVFISSEDQVGTQTWSDWIPAGCLSQAGLQGQHHHRKRHPKSDRGAGLEEMS